MRFPTIQFDQSIIVVLKPFKEAILNFIKFKTEIVLDRIKEDHSIIIPELDKINKINIDIHNFFRFSGFFTPLILLLRRFNCSRLERVFKLRKFARLEICTFHER